MKKRIISLLILVTLVCLGSAAMGSAATDPFTPVYSRAGECIFSDCRERPQNLSPGWDNTPFPNIEACGGHTTKDTAGSGETVEPAEREDRPYFDMPIVMNPKVENFMEYFQTRGRGVFTKWLERSQAYMPMVKEILTGAGLPADLAYLALIESGFNPNARSRAKAVGMWQFISGTARKYGLRVNWWIDERKDPEKATLAAATYLNDLYGIFNSWDLAAAGYNAGEGRITRAMKRYDTRDFWELSSQKKALKRETKDYVPKYMAAMVVAKNPEGYGFMDLNYMEPFSYEKVNIPEPIDIKVIAWAAGTTVEEIKRLNPELLRWFTPPDYPDYHIKIPAGTGKMFAERMAQVPKPERLKFHEHKVRKGETLSEIARLYSTDIKQLMHLNEINNPGRIRAGKLIVVPVRPGKNVRQAKSTTHPAAAPQRTYTVRKGDTLWDISRKFDVELDRLLKLNDLKKTDSIMPGREIYLKEASLEKTGQSNVYE